MGRVREITERPLRRSSVEWNRSENTETLSYTSKLDTRLQHRYREKRILVGKYISALLKNGRVGTGRIELVLHMKWMQSQL